MGRKFVPLGILVFIVLGGGIASCTPASLSALIRAASSSPSRTAATGAPASAGANLTIDASQRFQRIDGWGVNANPKNWAAYPPLAPALDFLVNDLGANLWRVDVFGRSDWEATNDNADPFTPDWTYYNNLYGTNPYFQSLWATLAELNAQGVQPILSASGLVPSWMGGGTINSNDEFVEMFATLVWYARNAAHIQFTLVDPLNETDLGMSEGPSVNASQFDAILSKLRTRLVSMGMPDVRFIAPETANPNTVYDGAILGDASVAPYIGAYAAHRYGTADVSDAVSQIKGSAYPQPDFWMAEYSSILYGYLDDGHQVPDEWAFTKDMMENLFSFLSTGASAALVWDAYDNVHDHSGNFTNWGLLATLNGYAPRTRYYAAKQVFAYVKPGSVRVQSVSSLSGVDTLSFVNDATGAVTLVGINWNTTAQTIYGSIANFNPPPSLTLYQTTATQNAAAAGSVPVSGGNFTVTVPADSIFTLTGGACSGCPTATATPTGAAINTSTPTPRPTATPSPGAQTAMFGRTSSSGTNDNSGIDDYNGSLTTVTSGGTLQALSVYAGAVTAGSHVRLTLYASDANGNPGQLLAQTSDATAMIGWNTISAPGVNVPPGTYWIMAQTDGAGTVYRMATGLPSSNALGWTGTNHPYGSFPATVTPWVKTNGQAFAMYGTLLLPAASTPPSVGGVAGVPAPAGATSDGGATHWRRIGVAALVAACLVCAAGWPAMRRRRHR